MKEVKTDIDYLMEQIRKKLTQKCDTCEYENSCKRKEFANFGCDDWLKRKTPLERLMERLNEKSEKN